MRPCLVLPRSSDAASIHSNLHHNLSYSGRLIVDCDPGDMSILREEDRETSCRYGQEIAGAIEQGIVSISVVGFLDRERVQFRPSHLFNASCNELHIYVFAMRLPHSFGFWLGRVVLNQGEYKGVRNRIHRLQRETVPDTNGTVVAEVISSTVFTQFFLEDVSRLLPKRIAVAAAFDYARLKTAGAVADSALGDAFQKLIANSS